jgi:HPt (histidine-containing phosphotransfer) domain-containing protein
MDYACGDAELYREVLSDYRDMIHEKADVIERAAADKDLERYTIEVHSLKSTSKSVGALKLSETAAELEACGSAGDWDTILEKTPALLMKYRELYDVISPYCREKEPQTAAKKEFDRAAVLGLLGQFSACMEEFDSIRGEEIAGKLAEYAYEPPMDGYMEQIGKAMNNFDYDTCKEVSQTWQQRLTGEDNGTEGSEDGESI